MLYVCTVGTGTAGRESNVAEGIMAAIRYADPDTLLLLPSSHEDSTAVADIVQEGIAESVAEVFIRPLSDHDDLLQCQQEIVAVVTEFKQRESEIVFNPTSGTKQMTTAAVLAAIELEIARIEYITGPRQNGVVITGQESISKVSAREFMAARYRQRAIELLRGGSSMAAAELLDDYQDIYPELYHWAMMCYHWQRFDYNRALSSAQHLPSNVGRQARRALDILRKAAPISLEHIIDIGQYVDFCLSCANNEEALSLIYRGVEMSAKLRLRDYYIDTDDLVIEAVSDNPELKVSKKLISKLRDMEKYGKIQVGLKLALELLSGSGSALCRNFLNNANNWQLLMLRNQTRYGHGMAFVSRGEVEELYRVWQNTLREEWGTKFDELYAQLKYPANGEIIFRKEAY